MSMGLNSIWLNKVKPPFPYSKTLKKKMIDYYKDLYKNQLGLNDYKLRVQNRLREEEIENKRLKRLSCLLNYEFRPDQRHLIIGTGTGGLAVELYKRGCTVFGIEPDVKANEIVKLKSREMGMTENNFYCCKAENLPFNSSYFDFIHCFTVIEHVDDVEKVIDEMIRVLKPRGYIYLATINYRLPYEGHYKILFPTFLPKPIGRLFLSLKRRPTQFLEHIQYITENKIDKILFSRNVIWYKIFASHPNWWYKRKNLHIRIERFLRRLDISRSLEFIIRKKSLLSKVFT